MTLLILIFLSGAAAAQDQHFTQFYASPLTLNPALAGTFDGGYRIAGLYRDQGRSLLDEPYRTVAAAIDLRFKVSSHKKVKKDAFGAGVLFYNDRASSVNFYTNQIAVAGAYHKALSNEGNQFLSLGAQAGIAQRNVNYDNITFNDQFNGSDGYTDPTGEIFPENNFSFGDFAIGLNYTYAPERRPGIFAGIAMHHILEPQVSFYANEAVESRRNDNRLLQKISAHVSFQIPLGESVELSPRALAYKQGPHLALNAGSNIRFLLDSSKGYALHLGGWARPVGNTGEGGNQSVAMDAAVVLAGIEYNNFLIGFSYDLQLKSLNSTGRRGSAFEISLAFIGNYDNEVILCPKF